MAARTFTLLITITDDAEDLPLISRIESQVQQALEEGTREHSGFSAALVNAAQGDRVDCLPGAEAPSTSRLHGAKRYHSDLLREETAG